MRSILVLVLSLSLPAWADPAHCAHEPTERSLAHCLDARTDQIRMQMEAYIGASTVDLMALSARKLIRLERQLRNSQRDWYRKIVRRCRIEPDPPVGAAICRLRETLARRHQVREELTEMRLQLGAAPLVPVPDEFEILIPLPDPPAGPQVDTRVPLRIPLSGD